MRYPKLKLATPAETNKSQNTFSLSGIFPPRPPHGGLFHAPHPGAGRTLVAQANQLRNKMRYLYLIVVDSGYITAYA